LFRRTVRDFSASARIGVARRDITPPVGIYNRAWGAAAHDTAAGIHRPLTATAIAIVPADRVHDATPADLSNAAPHDGAPLVLVTVDAGWWQLPEDEWFVRGAVLDRFGLDAARLMIAFTHTHAGPSICRGDADKPGGGMIAAYLASVRDAVVDAVGEALAAARPATLSWAYGKCNLAANRDLPDPQGNRHVCGYNPDNAADDTLLVGRITDDASGAIMGTIVNYACHPTTLAWENQLISPDYVGAMREVVEANTGGAPCAFLQGASGELAPREQYVGDTAIADQNGRRLGFAVLATLESLLPPRIALEYTGVVESGAPLATWRRTEVELPTTIAAECLQVRLPLKSLPPDDQIEQEIAACTDRVMAERLRRKLRVRRSVGTGATCDMPAWIWRVGDALIVGQPNEAYSNFQIVLREHFADHAVVVMNLVNGCVGYLSPPELHDLDIYQVWQSPFDRTALDELIRTCVDRMREMTRRAKQNAR